MTREEFQELTVLCAYAFPSPPQAQCLSCLWEVLRKCHYSALNSLDVFLLWYIWTIWKLACSKFTCGILKCALLDIILTGYHFVAIQQQSLLYLSEKTPYVWQWLYPSKAFPHALQLSPRLRVVQQRCSWETNARCHWIRHYLVLNLLPSTKSWWDYASGQEVQLTVCHIYVVPLFSIESLLNHKGFPSGSNYFQVIMKAHLYGSTAKFKVGWHHALALGWDLLSVWVSSSHFSVPVCLSWIDVSSPLFR